MENGNVCACGKTLDFAGLQQSLAALPKNRFVVCLYGSNGKFGQIEWMDPLAAYLREKGFVTVGITGPQYMSTEYFCKTDYTAIIQNEEVAGLERINVFIIIDEDRYVKYPETSRVLGCVHGTLDITSDVSLGNFIHNMPRMDGWLCPFTLNRKSRKMISNLWTGIADERYSVRKTPLFRIISVGYPRLAVLSQKVNGKNAELDSIIYAPTYKSIGISHKDDKQSQYALSIISVLLKSFPKHKIIYRPHIANLHEPIVELVKIVYVNEPRLVLDENAKREGTFARGALLITDTSLIRKSFSYSTLRPSICFQPWRKIDAENQFVDCAFIATSFNSLITTARYCINNLESLKKTIETCRNSVMPPIEATFANIANILEDFYNDRDIADSLTVQRMLSDSGHRELRIISRIKKIAQEDRNSYAAPIAAAVASAFNCDKILLVAFGLHMCRLFAPASSFFDLDGLVCTKFYGADFTSGKYGDIDPEYIIGLYQKAIAAYTTVNDSVARDFSESLLREFRDAIITGENPAD